jgi:hypothetical protein
MIYQELVVLIDYCIQLIFFIAICRLPYSSKQEFTQMQIPKWPKTITPLMVCWLQSLPVAAHDRVRLIASKFFDLYPFFWYT